MKTTNPESVLGLAQKLGLPVPALLERLSSAGILNKTADSQISDRDLSQLLDSLRSTVKTPTQRKTAVIERLMDAGYLPKSGTKGLKNDQSVTDPDALGQLSELAVKSAYTNQDIKLAQSLIELLPRKFQHSLALWFCSMGLPCVRLSHPLDALPNSLWMVSRPTTKSSENEVFSRAGKTPPVLIERDPYLSRESETPLVDDLKLDE